MKKFFKEYEITIWVVIFGILLMLLCSTQQIVQMLNN